MPGPGAAGAGELELWRVVGGADKGGILVRKAQEIGSEKEEERLSTGALVAELELVGDRLHYRLVDGSGPQQGWVGLRLPGKVLLDKAFRLRDEPDDANGVDMRRSPSQSACSKRLPSFHTVGDSHCVAGWPPYAIPHRSIGLLCYNVHRISLLKLKPELEPGDGVCFCVGEIDCRAHVGKHCVGAMTYQHVIDEIIDRYFTFLSELPRHLDLRIFVFNVLPPVRGRPKPELPEEEMALAEEAHGVRDDWGFNWSSLVPDKEHLAYVLYFNVRLKAECDKAGFTYFDVYHKYADEEGFMYPEFTDDQVHINDGGPIELALRRFGPWDTSTAKGETARTIDAFAMGKTPSRDVVLREARKTGLMLNFFTGF